MLDRLKALTTFAAILEEGSFRGAARRLGITPSTVSYHVGELEAFLGAPLLRRSTRRLAPTELGLEVGREAKTILAAAESALGAAGRAGGQLRGTLSLTMTSALIGAGIAERIAAFVQAHPQARFRLDVSDAAADLVGERYDLALRAGTLADSALKSRRIGAVERVIVRAPAYRTPPGAGPDRLDWIMLESMPPKRRLTSPAGDEVEVEPKAVTTVGSLEAMIELCVAGIGIATPPRHRVAGELAAGTLTEALPGWSIPPIDLYAVWPAAKTESPLRRAFLDEALRSWSPPKR
ncbi:LysR family transcriptional regulator [Parvularcula dongshanensis]|uniref:DNA-binding transcriptional LysR family regulator n=1 Tax=Parvularcula dongshanensis TaxID=1173995 RepID=A0A840I524_9PROT|nr:LysR family transcriptional regulator [Parvularcula dongshanensis]MBB4659304.1 DNA-binding transcriptional LysR family regulator [Parvularcula dongshanensis]